MTFTKQGSFHQQTPFSFDTALRAPKHTNYLPAALVFLYLLLLLLLLLFLLLLFLFYFIYIFISI